MHLRVYFMYNNMLIKKTTETDEAGISNVAKIIT